MKFTLMIGILIGTAGWMLFRGNDSAAKKILPADEAAAKLREAWSGYHAA